MKKGIQYLMVIAWLALAVWGVTGVYQRFVSGHELAAYGSYVPWGLWVSAYIYFIGMSAGAFILASIIYILRLKDLAQLARTALFTAAITLLLALLSIWFDLGHMWRFSEVFTRPNFSSVMTWMIWLYTVYFVLILVALWYNMRCDLAALGERRDSLSPLYRVLSVGWKCPSDPEGVAACHAVSERRLRALGYIGIPLCIAFHSGVGALFATLAARPYWHQSLFPILFLTGGLVSGGALLMAIVAMTVKEISGVLPILTRIVLALLCFDLLLELAETSIPMWYGVGNDYHLYQEILFGRFWYVFWIFHLALGSIIPLILLIWKPASRWATALAGSLIATTFLAVRLNLVIPGQITPALRGLREAYSDSRLQFDYVPSLFEWSVVAFIVALGFALFYLGRRFLPLEYLNSSKTQKEIS